MFKHLAFKAGLKPAQYWNSAFEDVLEMMQAHEQHKIHDWQLNREITYVLYCANTLEKDRVSKAQWLTLPGDKEEAVQRAETKEEMVERWKKMGLL